MVYIKVICCIWYKERKKIILKSFVKCIMCMSIYLLNFVEVCICIDVKWEYFKGFVDFKCGFNFYNK